MYFFQILHSKFCDKCPVEATNRASHKFGGCKGIQIKHSEFCIRRNCPSPRQRLPNLVNVTRGVKNVNFGYHAPQDPKPAFSLCTTSNCIKTTWLCSCSSRITKYLYI